MGFEFKGTWPVASSEEIKYANFEDLRKLCWATLRFVGSRGVFVYDDDEELNYSIWDTETVYHANECHGEIPFTTVVYMDDVLNEYVPYRNVLHVGADELPPPLNFKWKRLPRADVYCDWAKSAGTWIVMWVTRTGYAGLHIWPAYWELPPQLNKYTQQRKTIITKAHENHYVYVEGHLIRQSEGDVYDIYRCAKTHMSINEVSAFYYDALEEYVLYDLVYFRDELFICVVPTSLGEAPYVEESDLEEPPVVDVPPAYPRFSSNWMYAAQFKDSNFWTSIGVLPEDTTHAADLLYDKDQEKPVEFQRKDRHMVSRDENFDLITGAIGSKYFESHAPLALPPFYYPYHVSGGTPSTKHLYFDYSMQAYQSFIEFILESVGSYFVWFHTDDDTHYAINDYHWNCNYSSFEFTLEKLGEYDWYLDYDPLYGQGRSPRPNQDTLPGQDTLPNNPRACWRRTWKYALGYPASAYCDPTTGEPIIWDGENGLPPYAEKQVGEIKDVNYHLWDTYEPDYPWIWWYRIGNVEKARAEAVTYWQSLSDSAKQAIKDRREGVVTYHEASESPTHYINGEFYRKHEDFELQPELVNQMEDMFNYCIYVPVGGVPLSTEKRYGYGGLEASFSAVVANIVTAFSADSWSTDSVSNDFGHNGVCGAYWHPAAGILYGDVGGGGTSAYFSNERMVFTVAKSVFDDWPGHLDSLVGLRIRITAVGASFGLPPVVTTATHNQTNSWSVDKYGSGFGGTAYDAQWTAWYTIRLVEISASHYYFIAEPPSSDIGLIPSPPVPLGSGDYSTAALNYPVQPEGYINILNTEEPVAHVDVREYELGCVPVE